jgi:hypothetical protein
LFVANYYYYYYIYKRENNYSITFYLPEILLVQGVDVLPHDILIPQHFPAVGTRIRTHHLIVREHVLFPSIPMCESLRADLTHMVLRRAEVKALLVTLQRLHGRQNVGAVRTGNTSSFVHDHDMIAQLPLRLVALRALVAAKALRLGTCVLRLFGFAVEETTTCLAVHAKVNSLLVRRLVLRRRGNMIAERALELLVVVHQLDVFFEGMVSRDE